MDLEASPSSTDLDKRSSCLLVNKSCANWHRLGKRKFEEVEDGNRNVLASFNYSSVARVEIENECIALREALGSQQQSIRELYNELEEERDASSSATNETMSMILRLQREKAEIQMEARQFKCFVHDRMSHDQNELHVLDDLLYKREQAIQSLTCEVQAYKHRMLSFGLNEAEVDGGKDGDSRNQSMVDNFDTQFEFPSCDYPLLKCNLNETQGFTDADNNLEDLEKYPFGETPRGQEYLQDIECRIYQLEGTPSSSWMNGEFSGSRNILDKAVTGQSPRQNRHVRRISTESSDSFFGLVKGTDYECPTETPGPSGSFKKTEYFSHNEDYSNLRMVDNVSDPGNEMSDMLYTIDSVHHGMTCNGYTEPKAAIGICEESVTTPKESLNGADIGDSDFKKLYMRLQALEADRESMKQEIISMRTDKAQLILLREIAQNLCKEMSPERRMPVKKASIIGAFSFVSVLKRIVSFVFWRKKSHRIKYMFGLSSNNVGLLMLLDQGTCISQLRCLIKCRSVKPVLESSIHM